ncbi:MAG: flagellar biosynthesis protein FlhF [Treponema sp.]|nr:flagellar biosynthesis protein FlhF [Treponema sp.]
MQTYSMRGVSKGDCLQKIVNTYGIRFTVLSERTYRSPGILGLFSREGVELEFCLPSQRGFGLQSANAPNTLSALGGVPVQLGTEAYAPSPAGEQLVFPTARKAAAAASSGDDSTLDFIEAKKRVLAAAGKDPDQVFRQIQTEEEHNQQIILDKLQEIQAKIDTGAPKTEHPHLARIAQMLRQNDFSDSYTAAMMERARKELSLETLENFNAVQNRVIEWIGESVKIYPISAKQEFGGAGRIMALIGPTGVGKTTTIAKLAAIYGLENSGNRPLSVRMITIDAFRIGAKEQINNYGDIMEIPVSYIDNNRDLRREIDLYREETDLILVDTIGRSPRDSVKLGEMKELLDACGSKAEIHLVMSASIKTSDMEHILQQFEPFNYQAVLLTKLDETRHVGNVISALAERGKPISYITDGQSVPKDIKKASVVRFLINLDEFRVDREEVEKRFPAVEADQFQWG